MSSPIRNSRSRPSALYAGPPDSRAPYSDLMPAPSEMAQLEWDSMQPHSDSENQRPARPQPMSRASFAQIVAKRESQQGPKSPVESPGLQRPGMFRNSSSQESSPMSKGTVSKTSPSGYVGTGQGVGQGGGSYFVGTGQGRPNQTRRESKRQSTQDGRPIQEEDEFGQPMKLANPWYGHPMQEEIDPLAQGNGNYGQQPAAVHNNELPGARLDETVGKGCKCVIM